MDRWTTEVEGDTYTDIQWAAEKEVERFFEDREVKWELDIDPYLEITDGSGGRRYRYKATVRVTV